MNVGATFSKKINTKNANSLDYIKGTFSSLIEFESPYSNEVREITAELKTFALGHDGISASIASINK